jgi:hypothetical protein
MNSTQYGGRSNQRQVKTTDGVFQGGTYCVNFHVGGCESPASTIFPVLVYVEPAVSLA